MTDFLKLVRLPNLIILAFTQYMLRWCVLVPTLELRNHDLGFSMLGPVMSEFDFFLLVLSTVLIAAAGYIINDYFDVRIDEVNRPSTNVVGKTIKRRVAIVTHTGFNIIGAGLGIWLSWKYDMLRAGSFIYITAPALLWFYSTSLKRQFLVGNLVIALLTALVPLVAVLFELTGIYKEFIDLVSSGLLRLDNVLDVALFLALFAFLLSLLREIIKDTEDYEGDMEYGCKTLPIVAGVSTAKYVMLGLTAIVIVSLGWLMMQQFQAGDWISFAYFLLLLELPLAYLGWKIWKATGKKDWHKASLWVKLIMVAGVSFLFLYAREIQSIISESVS